MEFNGPKLKMEGMTCSVRADFAFLQGFSICQRTYPHMGDDGEGQLDMNQWEISCYSVKYKGCFFDKKGLKSLLVEI
jgi:hypothetical protein